MTQRWTIPSLLIALVLTGYAGPAAAEVTVCFAEVRLEKPDQQTKADEEKVRLLNESLKDILGREVGQLHTVLATAEKRLRGSQLPLRFDRVAGCTSLTLVIRTSGANFDAQVLYKDGLLTGPRPLQIDWRFNQPFDPATLRTLLYQVLISVSTDLTNIDTELLKRLVNDESESIKLSAVKITPEWCNAADNCAVLPKLTLNEYLLHSYFRLGVQLDGDLVEREVVSRASGLCAPYGGNDTRNLGIVVTHPKTELPSANAWVHVSFSLETVKFPPKGTTCRQPAVTAAVSQTEPRGAR